MDKTIIQFPKNKIVRPPSADNKKRGIVNFAESILLDFIENMIMDLEAQGIDTGTDEFNRDFSFSIECLRSTIYRGLGLETKLQEFMDHNVILHDNNVLDEIKDPSVKVDVESISPGKVKE
tara:strand:- start:3715 stop:4077 length:363 start_codon:yes stop_codon:yes gene_type:complete